MSGAEPAHGGHAEPAGTSEPRHGIVVVALVMSAIAGASLVLAARRPTPTAPVRIAAHRVDVNSASAEEIGLLPEVGAELAATIVADRESRGPFADVRDLDRVKGIGPATVAELEPYVRCAESSASPGGAAPR
ncbi:MAG: helix-hairpin-helix domain-containing protein [Phycisphaerales bacterium]